MFSKSLSVIILCPLLIGQCRADRGDPCAADTEVIVEKLCSSCPIFGTNPDAPITLKDVRREAKNHFEADRFNEAVICYNKIIGLKPKTKDYAGRADCLVKLNRNPEAIDDLMEAVSLAPRSGLFRGKLLNLLEDEGRIDELRLYEQQVACYVP